MTTMLRLETMGEAVRFNDEVFRKVEPYLGKNILEVGTGIGIFTERLLAKGSVLGVDIVPDHAEFRLMGRKALEALAEYPEANLFLRGLIPQLGFRSAQVLYDRRLRLAGKTKYPLRRMVGLGIDGITSFSAVPLRLIAATGAVLFVLSTVVALWVLAVRIFTDRAVPGWASITLPIYALGGVQLLSLGVVGEYVAKIYLEVKRRPRYIVERTTRDPAVVEARDKSQ